MPVDATERPEFLQLALRWTIKVDTQNTHGHPNLHRQFAITLWQGNVSER